MNAVSDVDYTLYHEKNALIASSGGVLTASQDFYRDLFPVGSFERKGHFEDNRPNGIFVNIHSDGSVSRYTLTDELSELPIAQSSDFSIISPVSYSGKARSGNNARFLYAFTVDLDGVGLHELKNLLYQFSTKVTIPPTYLVNSGTGFHLYYILDTPVPLYPQLQNRLKAVKYELIRYCWNLYTSTIKQPQIQGILQGFRVVGSPSKLGSDYPVIAFKLGNKYSLEQIMRELPKEVWIESTEYCSELSLEKAKQLYPEWYERRIVRGEPKGRWHVKRDLYDWWKNKITTETRFGHRYFCIMCLAIYAMKCDVPEDELRADALSFVDTFTEINNDHPFTKDDVINALEAFNECYCTFPRFDIEKISGISIPANKRNFRRQIDHIKLMNFVRDEINQNKNWRNVNGRPDKKHIVSDWRKAHPDGTKSDCIRDTGLSKPTVYKWWQMGSDF